MNKRICIVIPSHVDADLREQIQTHREALAKSYAAHPDVDVTVLLTADNPPANVESLLASCVGYNIDVVRLAKPTESQDAGSEGWFENATQVYAYCKKRRFDALHFSDAGASGFVCMQAKRTGIALMGTVLVVTLHGPSEWLHEGQQPTSNHPLFASKRDYAERYCCARADFIVSPSQSMLDWTTRAGWKLAARQRLIPSASDAAWIELLNAQPEPPQGHAKTPAALLPSVSVCIAHRNKGTSLRSTLQSLAANPYPNLDVVVVDDGSTCNASLAAWEKEAALHKSRGWRFVRQPRTGTVAALNRAVGLASGDLLIVLDSDRMPVTRMVADFVDGMVASSSDALSSYVASAGAECDEHSAPACVKRPLGPALTVGAIENVFGDMPFCIRRSVFEALGGFGCDAPQGFEAWSFLATAALKGYDVDVLPKELAQARAVDDRPLRSVAAVNAIVRAYGAVPAPSCDPALHRFLLAMSDALLLRAEQHNAAACEAATFQSATHSMQSVLQVLQQQNAELRLERDTLQATCVSLERLYAAAIEKQDEWLSQATRLSSECVALREQVIGLTGLLARDGYRSVDAMNRLLNRMPKVKYTLVRSARVAWHSASRAYSARQWFFPAFPDARNSG